MFGPFRSASELRIALKIVRKIFPFRDHTCSPESGKACFNFQIGLCPGVCVGKISRRDYLKLIRQLTLFFRGRKAQLVRSLEKEMKAAAKEQKFELASEIKRRLFALKHIQDVALIKKTAAKTGLRLEAYDIAHTSGKETVGAMVTSDNGELDKSGYRLFKLRGEFARQPHDIGNLVEVLQRRLNHSDWPVPAAIIVDGSKAQINAAKRVLKERDLNWPVVAVIKDEFHRARELIGDEIFIARHRQEILHLNAEAHRFALKFHRSRRKII